jgi:polar amino acid transport system substrate-binding protein
MVDIAEAVFRKAGYAVSFQPTPWTRALADTAAGRTAGIVGIYYAQARQRSFIVPSEPIGLSVNRLFVRADSSWTYTGADSLHGLVLGTIAGYDYGDLNPYIAGQLRANTGRVDEMHGNDALQANIRKLLERRLDVLVEDQLVVAYAARKLGAENRIRPAGTVEPRNRAGIAFSPKDPKAQEYARILSAGILELRRSGALKPILGRYAVTDWDE